MSLIRPKPRHADQVSDAFEQLFSASPMSKLLSVERGYSVNTSSLSVVKPSPFKLPAMVTPVAKIFLQLKRSEGTLSVDSDAVSRCDSRQFSTSTTDSDSSRLSFEQQQAQRHESLHFSTEAYHGNQALGPGSYMNCEERLGTDIGNKCMVLRSPRVCLERLDESVYEPEKSVVRGQESLPDNDEEESAEIALLSDGENNGLVLEENDGMAERDSGGKMASCYGLQENDEADYQAEPRNHGLGKQTGEYPQEDNVQRLVRKRKRTKARARNRNFVPEESESSDAENERRRREPRRRRHHLDEIKDDARDDTVARDERGINGRGSKSSDAENEGRRPESRRRRHHLEERIDGAEDNVVDRDLDEQERNHHESSDAENERRPEPRKSKRHLKERIVNTKDNATTRNSDERGGNSCESPDAENEGRRTAPRGRRHRTDERRDDAKDDAPEEEEENGCDGNIDSEEQQRRQSQENEPYDKFKANRRTTRAHVDDRRQSTGGESDKQDTEQRDMGRSDRSKDSDRSMSEDEEEETRDGPPDEDRECDDTRGTSMKQRTANNVTHSQSVTYSENTSNKKSLRKGALDRIISRLGGGRNQRMLRSSHHTGDEPADGDKNATRNARSFPQEKDGTRVQSTLSPGTTDEELDRPDKEHAPEMPVAVSCATPPFRRVTRVMAANRRLCTQEKARKPEDGICAKTASVDNARPVVQKEAKKKTTAARDLRETPVNSRKLLKVSSAVRQHTLENWTILPLGRNIIVDGHRPDDPANQFWHSNAIVKRISSHAVCTVSGTVYTLRGKMEEAKALAEGFSKKVIAAFKKGFPPTWKEIIQEHNEAKMTGRRSSKTRPSDMKTPVEQCKTKPKRKPNPNTTALETPVTISSLPKTRSGRHVIPQLAWWTGQRVTIDPNNYTVDITPGTPDTQCRVVPSNQRNKKRDLSHGSQLNRKCVTKVQKHEVTRRRFEKDNKSGRGKNDRDSQKRRHDVNVDVIKHGAPTRKLRQHREENSDARDSETETSINTPMQRLFSEHTGEVNGRNVADMDDTDDQQNTQSMEPVTRKQIVSKDRVRTLLFLERRERNGVTAPVRAAAVEVPQVRRGDSLSDEAGSCSSDSTNNSHGREKRGNPVSQLDYSDGVGSGSEASSPDANAGVSLDKRRQATLGSVANLQRDILRIVTKNKRQTARERLAGKALPCYSPRAENPVGDSSSAKSDDDDTGDVNERRKMTALGRTPRQQEDMHSMRRLDTQNGHAGDMMPLDVLQTEERVSRRSTPSDAPKNTPASRFRENMTDDILCRSVEHKRLFSGDDAGVRRQGDKPRAKRNGRSDNSKDRARVDPCGKERNTKSIKAKVSQKRSRKNNGKFYSQKEKDVLHPRTKGKVSSTRQVLSDDSNDEQATIERQVLSRQKALKIPEKTKRKTAAASSDKPEKLLGNFVGGVGTLKRKRQLREFVEQHECGYENDLFDSTPFQQRKVRKVTTQLGKNTVDDFFDVTAARMSFATPGTTPSSSLRSAWLPTSDKKTPSSSMAASPLMSEAVNRNAVDRYVNRLKRVAKRQGKKHVSSGRNEMSVPQRQTGEPLASVSPSVFQMANRSGDADSSNADDYYFSDGSDST